MNRRQQVAHDVSPRLREIFGPADARAVIALIELVASLADERDDILSAAIRVEVDGQP